MILEQHYLACLSQASYFISNGKVAAVVDPRRDVDLYVDRARELGVRIEHVLLTHFHADFLAGHLELAQRTGARIHLGARAQAEYPFEPMAEGDVLTFGDVRIEVLETPGHTPESVSYVVYDLARSADTPQAVLTGDALFIGDVGRPDLMASKGITANELASLLYDSLHGKLMKLPDETIVYPGHGAGSACGKNMSTDTSSTIGKQRALNWALQPMDKAEFVAQLTADQPPAPAYFPRAAERNKRTRPTLDDVIETELRPLQLPEFVAEHAAGAQVLDTRSKDDFAAGHLAGSINIGLDGRFASWAGTVLDLDRPILVIAKPGTEREVVTRLGRIGVDAVTGYLDGGPASFAARPDVAKTSRVTVQEAAAELRGAHPPVLLDVREPGEYEAAHVEGSQLLPLSQLTERLAEVPRGTRVLVHCKSGYRSMTAVSLLEAAGIPATDVAGGFDAWQAAGGT